MTVSPQPIAHLVWLQGRRAADDVEDYYEVARPGDKSVDGSDPFPVYAAPPPPAAVQEPVAVKAAWQDIARAPKDGTLLRLLVVPDPTEFTPFDDSLNPYETIGFNNLTDTDEDCWEFAGWSWSQDCFITGRGEVIGWSAFKDPAQQSSYEALQEAIRWCLDRDERNGSMPEAYANKLRSALSTSQSDPAIETKLSGINTDLLKALKYVRRFLNPEDHDVSYVDDVIDKAEGRGLYATTATEGE
jgi:hypothetical protein